MASMTSSRISGGTPRRLGDGAVIAGMNWKGGLTATQVRLGYTALVKVREYSRRMMPAAVKVIRLGCRPVQFLGFLLDEWQDSDRTISESETKDREDRKMVVVVFCFETLPVGKCRVKLNSIRVQPFHAFATTQLNQNHNTAAHPSSLLTYSLIVS